MASGIEKYLFPVGKLKWWAQALLIVGGFSIAFPQWNLKIIGFVLYIAAIITTFFANRRRRDGGEAVQQ